MAGVQEEVLDAFERDGFVVLPGFLDSAALGSAIEAIGTRLPTAEQLHADPSDERWAELADNPYAGSTDAPWFGPAIFHLATDAALVALARRLLRTDDLRAYAIETWAKYAGIASYEQALHRDCHSPLVPTAVGPIGQVELFVLLSDAEPEDGPIALVPNPLTRHLPLQREQWSRDEEPALYEAERLGVGRAGTIVAFRADTVHRATELTRPGGSRLSLSVNFRRADAEWLSRTSWGDHVWSDAWNGFAATATYEQLLLFGFPPAGHPYWTPATIAGMRVRYPGIDLGRWVAALA